MTASKKKNRLCEVWLPIVLFYVIAIVCRAISVCVLPAFCPDCRQNVVLQLCEGLGPALGALAVMCIFKKRMYCHVVGKSLLRSMTCIAFPVAMFLIFDKANGTSASLVFLGCTAYAFLEEVGWRGYLTGESKDMSQPKRVLIVAAFGFFHVFPSHRIV